MKLKEWSCRLLCNSSCENEKNWIAALMRALLNNMFFIKHKFYSNYSSFMSSSSNFSWVNAQGAQKQWVIKSLAKEPWIFLELLISLLLLPPIAPVEPQHQKSMPQQYNRASGPIDPVRLRTCLFWAYTIHGQNSAFTQVVTSAKHPNNPVDHSLSSTTGDYISTLLPSLGCRQPFHLVSCKSRLTFSKQI